MRPLKQQKEIWVLGSTGYVGAQLTNLLIQKRHEGEFPGRISTLGHRTILPRVMQRTNFFMSSLNKLKKDKFIDYPPDVVFHCARLAGRSDRGRRTAAKQGYRANIRLRDIFEQLPTPPMVVYCSGTLMYGNTGKIANEEQPISPIAYARAYEYAERPFTREPAEATLDVRTARPAWILGPDSWFEYFFYRPALKLGYVPYYGDGEQQMSIISVEDCAGQLIHVSTHGAPGENYNLFGFAPISQLAFANKTAKILDLDVRQIRENELIKKHGKTVAEALTSNTPITTLHTEWKASYNAVDHDLDLLIARAVKALDQR
ncbi:MAG: NAD(P)-dependent oxidoreductase [Schleiferiaceae bacterium]|nr:NAD(P)-dependent oxidoreductase [Schleiferiaceae bacterium]MDG1220512.1 NAD(P)-dependent oxidoreductase [Schleiferiaceae bacterium]